jgi:TRAP-type transport system periplasmic protein
MRKELLATTLLVTAMLFVTMIYAVPVSSFAAEQKPIELKFAMWNSMQHSMVVEIYQPFAKELEQRTQGRVKVTFYPNEALGKAKDQYDMAVRGISDISVFIHGYTPGRFPLAQVMELPTGVPSGKIGSRILWELYEKYMKQEYPGVKMLMLQTSEPGQVHATKKTVKVLSDFKGMRLRSPGPVQTSVLRALGGSPLTIPIPELYDSLQKGMADGALLPFSAIKDFKLGEVIKHHTIANLYVMTSGLVMNPNAYNSLSPGDQKIMDELTGLRMAEKSGEAFDRSAQVAQDEAKKAGSEIYQLPASERKVWMEKAKPVIDTWIADMEKKGLPGRKVFQEAMSLVDKYSK